MSQQNFLAFQKNVMKQLDSDITALLLSANLPSPLKEACEYTMYAKGKRVRPLLVANSFATIYYNSQQLNNDPIPLTISVRQSMLAVEFLHTYSLIHDDLPCMDDDDLRRGKPTCHIEFGEATALLAGDVLQSLAFEALTTELPTLHAESSNNSLHINNDIIGTLLQIFAPRARRMVSGQTLDIDGENKVLTQRELENIHKDKTGALIEAAVLMGAVCASVQSNSHNMLSIEKFAQALGLAFQVQDDVLDIIADTEQLGKPAGSDEKLEKSTYVKLMGVEGATDYAKTLFMEAKQHIEHLGNESYLVQFADTLWARKK